MLQLIDSINYDMECANVATTPSDRSYHCLRIEIAALQLSQLVESATYPTAYAAHLTDFLNEAFGLCQRLNGD